MAKGDRITSLAFNNVQTAVANILGTGSGTFGYGQTVASSTVNPNSLISSTQWTNLRNDMAKCYTHQTNSSVVDTLPVTGNTPSLNPPNLKLITGGTIISDAILQQYSNFINNASTGISAQRDAANAAQMVTGQSPSSTQRTSAWNGTISHTITYTFSGYSGVSASNHIRVFFNAGGSIQISASRSGGDTGPPPSSTAKNNDWTSLLSAFGTFSFRADTSDISGSLNSGGTISSTVGYRDLVVGNLTTLLQQPGSSGVYAENFYRIRVTLLSNGGLNNQLQFTILFEDNDVGDRPPASPPPPFGPLVDENVNGTLTSSSSVTTATGANVSVPAPTASATAL